MTTSMMSISKSDSIETVPYKKLSETAKSLLSREDIDIDDLYEAIEQLQEERGRYVLVF